MAYNIVPTVATGDSWTAAQHNTYIRDNFSAVWPFNAAGDIAYASSASALSKVAGVSGGVLRSTGSTLGWLAPPGLPYRFLRSSANGLDFSWDSLDACVVSTTATQPIIHGGSSILHWDSEVFDPRGWHSSSPDSMIVVNVGGYFQATVFILYDGGGSGTYRETIDIRKDGYTVSADRKWITADADSKATCMTTPIFPMSAGQRLEAFLDQLSGSTRTLQPLCYFSLWRVHGG